MNDLEKAAQDALHVLTQINSHFEDGATEVYAGGLICDNEDTLKENVARVTLALAAQLEPTRNEFSVNGPNLPYTPRSKRRRLAKNFYGNWVGFMGKRKIKDFGKSEEIPQEALIWLLADA